MKSSWLCATLLPLFLFSCALPEKPCQWKDKIPDIQRVEVHSSVFLPCPRFSAIEMMFHLHKGQSVVATVRYGNISHVSNSKNIGKTINHYVNMDNNATRFVLYNITRNATALYTCTAIIFYPPPFRNIKDEPQTIVIVERNTCVQSTHPQETSASDLPLWVGFGILSAYGLIITCTALSLRFRLKREDMNTHDYINMKPRTRKRKQGIHHPTHLSWYNDSANGMAVSKNQSKISPISI